MKEFTIEIVNTYGYLGILILTTLESIIPIIPAEVILTFGGFATTVTNVTQTGVILFATIGELAGAIVLYSVGYFIPQKQLDKIITGRFAKLIHVNQEDIEKSKDWFIHKGSYTVLFSKCIPVIGSLISIPAGMAHMNMILFLIFTLAGITAWNTVLVLFGATIKKSFDIIFSADTLCTKVLALVFVICFAITVINLLWRKKHKEL
jgi:Uncharacterized membrane-associated protein